MYISKLIAICLNREKYIIKKRQFRIPYFCYNFFPAHKNLVYLHITDVQFMIDRLIEVRVSNSLIIFIYQLII